MEGDRWPVDGCDHSAVGTTGQAEQTAVGAQTEGEGKSALRGVFQGRGWWERDPGLGWVFPGDLPLSTQHRGLKTVVGFGAAPHCGCTPKLALVCLSYGKA